MKGYFLIIWMMLPTSAIAQDTEWQIMDGESSINFSVIVEDNPSGGEFTKFSADIVFDPKILDQAQIKVLVDLKHIDAFYSDVAENLKKKEWFDVEQYPIARFISQKFKHLGGNDYQATGDLTLRDVTRPEILYFTLTEFGGRRAAIKGRMEINRLEYGVGQGGWRDVSSVGGQVFLDVVVKVVKR